MSWDIVIVGGGGGGGDFSGSLWMTPLCEKLGSASRSLGYSGTSENRHSEKGTTSLDKGRSVRS